MLNDLLSILRAMTPSFPQKGRIQLLSACVGSLSGYATAKINATPIPTTLRQTYDRR
jgi:hypothetical protein